MRLTKEREAEIRRWVFGNQAFGDGPDDCPTLKRDLLAELDAVRAERDSLRTALDTQPAASTVAADIAQMARDMVHRGKHSVEGLAAHIQRSLDAARADERAKVVAWLNRRANELGVSNARYAHAYADAYETAADDIEHGEHEAKP